MEKHIASHDASDMMVYENLRTQASKLDIKLRFGLVRGALEKIFRGFELLGRFAKQLRRSSSGFFQPKHTDFSSTATAVYSITIASVLISFFWLTLLLYTA